MEINKIYQGSTLEVLKQMPDDFVNCIVTSPPYWGLRDYGIQGQIGLEPTLEEYLNNILAITKELKRVLRPDGVMFWNHGDCYCGSQGQIDAKNPKAMEGKLIPHQKDYQSKCMVMQNYRLIIKMIDEQGWINRNNIVWHKPNAMPSSVKDRFSNSYEPVFMLVKNKKYWFDLDAVRIPHKTNENRPMGIDREKNYPNAKRNKNAFNYRVRDAEKKSEQCPQFKASEEEIKNYTTKIPKENAESFGSPRARQHRQKYITPEQQKETQDKTGWVNGSGRIRSFYDNFGGLTNPKGKNPGDVWRIATHPFSEAHFATFPEKLITPMIKAGCPEGGIVLDPFSGASTTGVVSLKLGRKYIGIELNKTYCEMAKKRIEKEVGTLFNKIEIIK